MDVRFLVLLFLLVSCVPQSQVSKGNLAQGTGTTTGGTTGTTPTGIPTAATTWNYLAQNVASITINVSNLNNAYIVGSEVEKYLGTLTSNVLTNFTGVDYCVVSDYSLGGVKLQLRTRAVPTAYYDFTAKRTVRILRVDFHDVSNSSSSCAYTLKVQDPSNGAYITDNTAPASPVYVPANLCPSCTSLVTATRVRIFRKELSTLKEVPTPSVNLASLVMSVDPNYNTTGSAGTCTNFDCKARGFDCCLENQCVQDGSARPSAATLYQSQWLVAEQERLSNTLAYINYPHIYYVCGTTVLPTTGNQNTGGNPTGAIDYDTAFIQLKKDYKCIEHIKSQATVTPFHNEVLSRATPYTAATDCLTSAAEAGQTMYFQEVVKRLYSTCGCSKTELSDMIVSCPAYDYTVTLKDAAGEPTRIDCYTPPSSVEVPNIQTVSVSARSAPHRFFENSNGLEKDIVGSERTYTSNGVTYDYTQEGEKFEYMDDGGILPVQQNFSMNAILGQMTVTLDKALPAKTVTVEVDQIYLLSTQSGYYTPCPDCARDSWISTFSAFPSSSQGVGLQAVGHSTARDEIGTNYTSGNYEDTIFGRACWIPPTMIPFSHQSKTSVKDQRIARLQTQASYFVNGYQRDWYGFNKGALIGSFDGVTWFAIGKGRIIKSTSRKLFLAINAPFADLATPSLHVVQVQNYDGITQTATYDYHPEYHLSHPYQNEAGNCQANHLCKTDTDCVSRLGWEYVCSDIREVKTEWPVFDVDANEKAGTTEIVTLDQILQQKRLPSTVTSRCVYRGAGAPCIANSGSIAKMTSRKNLTCAPNFYCANISHSAHSSKVARWAAKLEDIPVTKNHVYGKDTNILGRPLNYINSSGGSSLPALAKTAIQANLTHNDSTNAAQYSGICQPGKKLPSTAGILTNPYEQHKEADTNRRADFINQIGTCNSTFFNSARYTSCPTFNTDGNYEIFGYLDTAKTEWLNGAFATGYEKRSRSQNSCGLDSLATDAPALTTNADTLLNYSAFRQVESRPLNVTATVADPTLVRDACLRRAGAVCHTDLDCSPNKFHSNQVDNLALKYFGNEAEQNYYREYLVCGQADSKPLPSNAEAFKTYDMSKNRCCREVGKDLTTYTPDTPDTPDEDGTVNYVTATKDLDTITAPGINPKNLMRYSRFTSVDQLGVLLSATTITARPHLAGLPAATLFERPYLSGNVTRSGTTTLTTTNRNASTPYQWMTLNEVNSETCCGGGWIRKFSDGTTDWTKTNRLFLDVNNFKCINSSSVLLTDPTKVSTQYGFTKEADATVVGGEADVLNLVSRDFFNYCRDSSGVSGSCAQYGIPSENKEVDPVDDPYPRGYNGATWSPEIQVDTINPKFDLFTSTIDGKTYKNADLYFRPASGDSDSSVVIDFASTAPEARRNINLKIPSFIPRKGFDDRLAAGDVVIKLVDAEETTPFGRSCGEGTPSLKTLMNPLTSDSGGTYCPDAEWCCWAYDKDNRLLKVITDDANYGDTWNTRRVGVRFAFGAAGGALTSGATAPLINRKKPASDLYYLKRLGRLELSGIPQMGFEPLYCSDNSDRIVPGIFKSTVATTKAQFENADGSVSYKGSSYYNTTHHNLDFEPIFSANDFKCCAKLGKIVDKQDKCCSGYGTAFGDGTAFTCMLPAGTDLMVYFNRFVSNEGTDKDGPGGGLKDEDFDPSTGEPGFLWNNAKLATPVSPVITSVIDKVRALGNAYCDGKGKSKVRQGAAFGSFGAEPLGPSTNLQAPFYTIVDSSRDFATNSNAGETVDNGYNKFMDGFRWNHHLYCNDGN